MPSTQVMPLSIDVTTSPEGKRLFEGPEEPPSASSARSHQAPDHPGIASRKVGLPGATIHEPCSDRLPGQVTCILPQEEVGMADVKSSLSL